MYDFKNPDGSAENFLLAALPEPEYRRILPQFVEAELRIGEVIFREGEPIEELYFLRSGVVSLLTLVDDHSMIEVGLVGSEGVVGLSAYLGVAVASHRAIVQGDGRALRIGSDDLFRECQYGGGLPRMLRRYAQSSIFQVSQSAACFRFHPIESRLARWLLMTSDRMRIPVFRITQEFLSNMLGVRREAVNKTISTLQHSNLIDHGRGRVSIVDRPGLESLACSCYFAIRNEEASFPVFEAAAPRNG